MLKWDIDGFGRDRKDVFEQSLVIYNHSMDTRDEILNKVNIVDYISKTVSLKQNGRDFIGLCPFHNEKTPSFRVSPDKGFFYCFGCKAGGDVIKFLALKNNISYGMALRLLAEENGIAIQYSDPKKNDKLKKYLEANKIAARFFYDNIFKDKENNGAYKYLMEREIKEETIKKFGLGHDASWDSLSQFLLSKYDDLSPFLELALIYKNEKGQSKYFDKYHHRLVFPIINHRNEVIGFSGRILEDNPKVGKYINSNDSDIFHKKDNLFGLNLTRESIMLEKKAIIVEGQMDVISLYQGGIKNVTASLGTAFTEYQARLLKKWTDHVIICYDNDDAGIKATVSSGVILMLEGFNVKVANFEHIDNESGIEQKKPKDPDEFIKRYGKDAFLKVIENAVPFIDFRLHNEIQKYDIENIDEMFAYINEAIKIIIDLDPVEQDYYIDKIAEQTGRTKTAISQKMSSELKNKKHTSVPANSFERMAEEAPNKEYGFDSTEEEKILYILFTGDETLVLTIEDDWLEQTILSPTFIEQIKKLKTFISDNVNLTIEETKDYMENVFTKEKFEKIKKSKITVPPNRKKEFEGLFLNAKINFLRSEIKNQEKLLDFDISDPAKRKEIDEKVYLEIQKMRSEIQIINKKLKDV